MMNRLVVPLCAAVLLMVPGNLSAAVAVSTPLNLVNEGGFNQLAISLALPEFETGNDTTTLTGTADAALEIDPNTGEVTRLSFTGGAVSGTPITLTGDSANILNPGSYSFTSTTLSGRLNTFNPPSPVDNAPASGDFDATRHDVIINGGILSGAVSSLFVNTTINQNFAASPITAAGSGIGNIQRILRNDLSTATYRVFDLVVIIPVNSLSDVESGGVIVTFGATGTLKLTGQITVPFLPQIFNFSPNPQIVANGTSLGLDYDVSNADTLNIDNGVGGVTPTGVGSKPVIPPDSSDLTYTLTAGNGNGSVTRSLFIRAVDPGSASFRYVRFTPVRLKADLPGFSAADGIQVADFQFFDGGTERVPVGVTNPGGDSPANEGPVNLIDANPATKWFDFNRSSVIFDFSSAVPINSYRFTTANDAQERDPVAWELSGSANLTNWTIIDSITIWKGDPGRQFNHYTPFARQVPTQMIPIPAVPTVPPALIALFSPNPQIIVNGTPLELDYQAVNATTLDIDNGVGPVTPVDFGSKQVLPPDNSDLTYTLTAANGNGPVTRNTFVRTVEQGSATFRYVRFTPVRLKDDLPGISAADGIQVADFQFFNGATERVPAAATNPGGNNPTNEGPANLIDANPATKWFDFNRSSVIFDFNSPVTLNSYRFTTGDDSEERDPIAWELSGSDDQTNWSIIDAITVWKDDAGREFNYFTPFARQTPTSIIPIPAVPTIPPAVITRFEGSPQILTDGASTDLSWETDSALALEIDNGIGVVTGPSGAQSITPPANSDTRYVLTAANEVGQQVEAPTIVRTVIPGSANYRYVRWTPIRLAETLPGYGDANSVQLAEFEFLNGGAPVLPLGITNPGGNNPPAQPPANAIDGNSESVWLDFNKQGLVFDFGSPKSFTAYRWRTAADEPQRDPVAWSLDGSNDRFTWSRIDLIDKSRANPVEEVAFQAGLPRGTYTSVVPVPASSSLLPVIDQFVGDAPFLVSGEPLLLTWSATGATSTFIDQGIGTVPTSGSAVEMPSGNATYTLTASNPAGNVTAQFSTVIVTPALAGICYEGFDLAGDELGLLGDAAIVNDFGNIPLPGDMDRLRLTPDTASQNSTVWFRKRLNLSQGFQSVIDLHFLGANNSGADGLAFIIQNTPEGNGAELTGLNEEGLPANALNIKFDSYFNGGDPSAAFIQVKNGTTVLETADLTTIGGITLPGSIPNDLSSDDFSAAPYAVRIAYVPGDLDLFFQEVLVIDSLNVDLAAIGALDGNGKGYVGFSSRTGEFTENHDVTRWILVEGPPAPPLVISKVVVNLAADTVTLTFASSEFRTYAIEQSADAINFTSLATGIPGAAGTNQTTTSPIDFIETPAKFFRIVQEKP